MLYKHKKTGNIYRHVAYGRDCTNGERDGTRVVIYRPLGGNGTATYVRDYEEHMEKFEILAEFGDDLPKHDQPGWGDSLA